MKTAGARLRPFLWLCAPVFVWCGVPEVCATDQAQPRPRAVVGQILIEGLQRTHDDIVRRELLFKSGTQLDSTLLAESLRNLRRLPYLADPRFSFGLGDTLGDQQPVHITVHARDRYARALSPLLSGELGNVNLGLVALDYNFRGRGQSLQLTLDHHHIEGQRFEADYLMPRLRHGAHDLQVRGGFSSDGHLAQLRLSRPFRTLADRRTYGLSLQRQRRIERRYSSGALAARFSDDTATASLWAGTSSGDRLKVRPSLALEFSDNEYAPSRAFTLVPADRRRVILSSSLTLWTPRYQQARYIDLLGITEDIQTGSWARIRLGASVPSLGADRGYPFVQLTLAPRGTLRRGLFVFANLFFSSRWERDSYANLRAWYQLKSVARIGTKHSLAFRLYGDLLARSENKAQFIVGVENGLRGYAPRALDGTRLLLANLAWRPTLIETPAYVLAGSLFADAGSAWSGDAGSLDIKTSAGFGWRLGLPQVYNSPVLRLDLAYGATWQLSFGVGHYF